MISKLIATLLAAVLALPLFARGADATIERVEPPSWWVGMKSDKLQLMVHGAGIGASRHS